jgi:hypothetical protein
MAFGSNPHIFGVNESSCGIHEQQTVAGRDVVPAVLGTCIFYRTAKRSNFEQFQQEHVSRHEGLHLHSS